MTSALIENNHNKLNPENESGQAISHRLAAQLKRCQLTTSDLPTSQEQWAKLLHIIDSTYTSHHEAYYVLERSLEVSSQEMNTLYENLKQESAQRIDALHKSEQKTRFMANMSHELRTPIHGVMGSLDVLRETKLDERQATFINTAYSSCEVMLELVSNILDYSKIQSGQLSLEKIDFSPRALVEDIGQMMATMAQKKDLKVYCYAPVDIPELVFGDVVRIRQVLMNIASNAIKFTEKGEVLISLEVREITENEANLVFEIRDTGIGIPKAMQESIFESFVQVDGSINRRYGGTGLGLTIVKELVNIMAGRVWLTSIPEQGSQFWVELKLPIKPVNTLEIDDDYLAGRYVLVVEDQQTHQTILKNYLKAWHARPIIANNGMEALQMLRNSIALNEPFSAIILERLLPEMDGKTLARSIRTDRHYDRLPLIMLSSQDLDKAEQHENGVNACICTPLKAKALKTLLIQQIRHKASLTPNQAAFLQQDQNIQDTHQAPAILLAEDNPINALIATTMLEGLPYRIDQVSNGKEAFYKATHYPYHLILMDINMPDMDGFSATQALREWEQANGLASVPIIALTANALKDDREKCLAAGLNDYLAKPVKKDEILKTVNHWLKLSPLNKQLSSKLLIEMF
ncbi:response regulator [uncultured Thiothrix sp.]|uniref:response regulator n=1 Tax=uncultured Thiothrix sp. TaxID=223185 RepID=UPI0026168757|nr:response regulator [uncultured Thiothrix sp.]